MYSVKKARTYGRLFPDKERDLEALMIGDGNIFILSQLIGRMAKDGAVKLNLGDSDISIFIEADEGGKDTGWNKFMDGFAYFIRKLILHIYYQPFGCYATHSLTNIISQY